MPKEFSQAVGYVIVGLYAGGLIAVLIDNSFLRAVCAFTILVVALCGLFIIGVKLTGWLD